MEAGREPTERKNWNCTYRSSHSPGQTILEHPIRDPRAPPPAVHREQTLSDT